MPLYCLPVSAALPSKQSTRRIDVVPVGKVDGKTVMIVAAVGLVNEVMALLFARGRKGDLMSWCVKSEPFQWRDPNNSAVRPALFDAAPCNQRSRRG
jgi:hypothetical protein